MLKTHEIKTIVIDHIAINYFYTREKNDINGNSRFRVYIMDPDTAIIYETIFKCYESQLSERVRMFAEERQ